MDFTLKEQSSAELTEKVTEKNTAIAYASGTAPVYATPALVGLMEHAAVKAVDSQLPVGMAVTAMAVLTEQDRRKLTFKITACDAAGPVGEGIHERFIIEAAPFTEKANSKLK